jgi:ssDNA-binding Zn-finger/Zn-ribbon topoisomerase 1
MAKNEIDMTCFLCGKPTVCTETDAGNRSFYRCSNPECGEYEISVAAMRRVESATGHKEQLMQYVCAYRDTDKFVEVIVGPDNQVVAQPVQRGSSAT